MAELSGSGSIDDVMLMATCDEYKANLTAGLAPYEIVNFVTPHNDQVWTARDSVWLIVMGVYVGIVSLVHLLLGTLSFVMIFKKDCLRLSAKTFFVIYFMLGVLGYTQALHLLLDPYGLFTFISKKFPRWIIISRLFALSGFPSLVACCTLIIFTLITLRISGSANPWYKKWKYVIPIAISPYIIATIAEVISYFIPYPALISIIVCMSFFSLWGITVCIGYLFSGICLLKEVETRKKRTMRKSASTPNAPGHFDNQISRQPKKNMGKRMNNATRKITIITYSSAILGVIYSALTGINLTLVCLLVFHDCLGRFKRGNSNIWLGLQGGTRIMEVILACVIFYSITDMTIIVTFVKKILICGSSCCRNQKVVQKCEKCNANGTSHSNNPHSFCHSKNDPEMCIHTSDRPTDTDDTVLDELQSCNQTQNSTVEVNADGLPQEVAIEMHPGLEDTQTQVITVENRKEMSSMNSQTGLTNPRAFMLNAQKDSATSIETVVNSLDINCSPLRRAELKPHTSASSGIATATDTDLSSLDTLDLERHSLGTEAGAVTAVEDSEAKCSSTSEQQTRDKRTGLGARPPVTIVTLGSMSSVGTQTVEQRSIACQTESSSASQKPVPKPRSLFPDKAASKERSRRKRLREQLQKKDQSNFQRKQTV